MENDFSKTSEIEMKDHKWMPSLSIILNTRQKDLKEINPIMTDYFEHGRLNLTMLEEYISIVMDIHKMIDGQDYHDVYPMQYCTQEMFTAFGITPDENINRTRLCPNITQSEKFKVAGSMENKVNRTSFSLAIR